MKELLEKLNNVDFVLIVANSVLQLREEVGRLRKGKFKIIEKSVVCLKKDDVFNDLLYISSVIGDDRDILFVFTDAHKLSRKTEKRFVSFLEKFKKKTMNRKLVLCVDRTNTTKLVDDLIATSDRVTLKDVETGRIKKLIEKNIGGLIVDKIIKISVGKMS